MRTIVAGALAVAALAAAWASAPGGRAADIKETKQAFDLFDGDRKVGATTVSTMLVGETAILNQTFTAQERKGQVGWDSMFVYRTGGEVPTPQKATGTTRLDDFKLMDGTAEFLASEAGGGMKAKVTIKGYANGEKRPFREVQTTERTVAVPEGTVLSFAAFLHFARELAPRPGRREGYVYARIPAGLEYPDFEQFSGEMVLERGPFGPDGSYTIELKKQYAGGNFRTAFSVTYDRSGAVTEAFLLPLVLRPPAK